MRKRALLISLIAGIAFIFGGVSYGQAPPAGGSGQPAPAAAAPAKAKRKAGSKKKSKGKGKKGVAKAKGSKGKGKKGPKKAAIHREHPAIAALRFNKRWNLAVENALVRRYRPPHYPKRIDVRRAYEMGYLVPLRQTAALDFDSSFAEFAKDDIATYQLVRREVRPRVEAFASAVPLQPGEKILFTSAIRTDWYQGQVKSRYRGKAAPHRSPASFTSHRTGMATDITSKNLSPATQVAISRMLLKERAAGRVYAVWEGDSWHVTWLRDKRCRLHS